MSSLANISLGKHSLTMLIHSNCACHAKTFTMSVSTLINITLLRPEHYFPVHIHNTEPFPYVSRKNINFNFVMVVASFSYVGFLKVASLPAGWSVQLRFVLYIRQIKKNRAAKEKECKVFGLFLL